LKNFILFRAPAPDYGVLPQARRCDEPRNVETDKTGDTAAFHIISPHAAHFISDIRESEQKIP
jgi:hypothetical protein